MVNAPTMVRCKGNSKGKVIKDSEGNIKIEVDVNKRYITLAPVANLVGLAFNLEDPNNLLESNKKGITVVLIKNNPGLKKEYYHNPLDVGFPNGTIKGKLIIDLDQVIGGEDKVVKGGRC